MELCVLDTRAGTELEHASLSTLGVSVSPILPPPPSSSSSLAPPPPPPGAQSPLPGGSSGASSSGASGDAVSSPTLPPPPPPPLGTYHNAFRACEGRLYLLGRQELRAVRVQGWSQRVESLVQAGEWLEALAVALDHFEQKILPAEGTMGADGSGGASAHGSDGGYSGAGGFGAGSRHGSSSGDPWGGGAWRGGAAMTAAAAGSGRGRQQRRPLPPPPPRSEAAEHISDLLAQYLRLAINNAPAAESPSALAAAAGGAGAMGSSGAGGRARINLAHSHFQMLAGVCAEFCAVTGRLDMLFGPIFHAFRARGQQGWVWVGWVGGCVVVVGVLLLFFEQKCYYISRVSGFCFSAL